MARPLARRISLALYTWALPQWTLAQCPAPDLKMLTVYGGSVQFALSTETQLQSSEAVLSSHTRLTIRFRVCELTALADEWELKLGAADDALYPVGIPSPGAPIPLSDVLVEVTTLSSRNCDVTTPSTFHPTNSPQTLAKGRWNGPSLPDDVMEAELLLTYKLREPMWGRKPGVYLTNLNLLLKED